MIIIEEITELREFGKANEGSVVTIGNFDGVHLGHREILKTARNTADKKQKKLIAITFEPHPAAVLYPEKSPGVLTPLKLKIHLLEKFGVDCLFVLKTTPQILGLSPAAFVDKILTSATFLSIAVEGDNFNFGYGRAGNVYTLQSIGSANGFDVIIVEPINARLSIGHCVKVSSTLIRNLLTEAKVADAAIALGRAYKLTGKIIPGRGKGKQLGFPTLNLEISNQIIPAEAVYAGTVEISDTLENLLDANKQIPAALSVGHTLTLGPYNPLAVEAHLLTEDAEKIKGQWMSIDFIKWIRPQNKFETEADLSAQIEKDCKSIASILAD